MLIDSHCHLDFACFDKDRDDILAKLETNNITHLVIPGTQASAWQKQIDLANSHTNISFALGLHPHFLAHFQESDLQTLQELLLKYKGKGCVALGEIGLDKFVNIDEELQEKVFITQLNIAKQLKLPLILHVVKKQARVLELLMQTQFSYGGVYHAFSGSVEVANEFIKLGFKLGVGGVITYPTANKTRNTLAKLPISSLLLETDAPDMPIYQQSEKLNSPLNLPAIFDKLCTLRSESKQELETHLALNSQSIFSIVDD